MNSSKFSRFIGGVLLAICLLVLGSCGGAGGGGGGGGVDDSGIFLNAPLIVPIDVSQVTTSDIDMGLNLDCNGDFITDDPEPFGAHVADLTVSATYLPGVESPPAAPSVHIFKYIVEYKLNPNTTDPGPAFPKREYFESFDFDVGGSVTFSAELMTADMKTSNLPWLFGHPNYTVVYTIFGQDTFGNDVWSQGETSVTVGDFDNCGN